MDKNLLHEELNNLLKKASENTKLAIDYMAEFGVKPEGRVELFLPPDTREKEINRLPYEHGAKQTVIYETEKGEFSALCPFSGLPDYGTLTIEYMPGSWILELKSLKYYILSWRNIGATQEDITAFIFKDISQQLENPDYLLVTTSYNVRGGITTTCKIDSRQQ